jgi:acetyl-CoA C-acetyltransferase
MVCTPAPVDEEAQGRGVTEAYTVVYDREGAPERGIVLGRTQDGKRFLANTPSDRSLLEDFVAIEEIGREGKLSQQEGMTVFEPV